MWTRKRGTSRSTTFMRSNSIGALTVAAVLAASVLGSAGLYAQDAALPNGSVSIKLPDDSPVALLGFSTEPSRATMRGAAMVLDLHLALMLRNSGTAGRIHGITLRVVSQEVTMGGKGSVTI